VGEAEVAEVEAVEAADAVVAGEATGATIEGHVRELCDLDRRRPLADSGRNVEQVA
jgi:hypothetical protein